MLDLIELMDVLVFQTVLWQVVKLAQSIARSHPCTSACMNVTVACLRGQRRRAPDAYITGAVLVCLVRSVTLATCVMWRRVRPSKGRVRQCTQKREPGTDVAVVPDGHQALRRHGNYYLVEEKHEPEEV